MWASFPIRNFPFPAMVFLSAARPEKKKLFASRFFVFKRQPQLFCIFEKKHRRRSSYSRLKWQRRKSQMHAESTTTIPPNVNDESISEHRDYLFENNFFLFFSFSLSTRIIYFAQFPLPDCVSESIDGAQTTHTHTHATGRCRFYNMYPRTLRCVMCHVSFFSSTFRSYMLGVCGVCV